MRPMIFPAVDGLSLTLRAVAVTSFQAVSSGFEGVRYSLYKWFTSIRAAEPGMKEEPYCHIS